MTDEIIGYRGKTDGGGAAPLFCTDCGETVGREVVPLTNESLEKFASASCYVCDVTFYPTGSDIEENPELYQALADDDT